MVETNTTISEFRVVTKRVIEIELAHPDAKLPFSADEGSSGFDLFSVEEVTLQPGERKIVPTGLKWNPNDNKLEMQIRSRSGLAENYGVIVLNAPCFIPHNYNQAIDILLINHSNESYKIKVGDPIAEFSIVRVEHDFSFDVISTQKVNYYGK